MTLKPRISVIVPHTGKIELQDVIENLSQQTFQAYEILIIYQEKDFASVSPTLNYPKQIVKFIRCDLYAEPRNVGIKIARGDYICFIYPNYRSLPTRFKLQLDFLERDKLVAIAGGLAVSGNLDNFEYSATCWAHSGIFVNLLFGEFPVPASLMFRRSFLNKQYLRFNKMYSDAADYDLLCRCAKQGKIKNLGEFIITTSKGSKHLSLNTYDHHKVQVRQIKCSGIRLNDYERELHLDLMNLRHLSLERIEEGVKWLNVVLSKNRKLKYFNQAQLLSMFDKIISRLYSIATQNDRSDTDTKLGGWSIENALLNHIFSILPPNKTVLELGSGFGTNELLSKYRVYSIEHDPNYAFLRSAKHHCFYAPIVNNWYKRKVVQKALNQQFDLILVDGPPGVLRFGIIDNLDLFANIKCPILFDDINRSDDKEIMELFCSSLNYNFEIIQGEEKSFAYCLPLINKI